MKKYYFRRCVFIGGKIVSENEKKRLLETRKNCYESEFIYIGIFKNKNDCLKQYESWRSLLG